MKSRVSTKELIWDWIERNCETEHESGIAIFLYMHDDNTSLVQESVTAQNEGSNPPIPKSAMTDEKTDKVPPPH